ncbi:hypothetical protein [Telmatospirillum sp. J64-1]|uniref:hypothetical protein n=1 Tax=Telmatospirillum sp. J64-1 TaxID=2502183 RepID=UPI00115D5E25|nr:hypothetical protein [Telmatospirillum sp. J64-1]
MSVYDAASRIFAALLNDKPKSIKQESREWRLKKMAEDPAFAPGGWIVPGQVEPTTEQKAEPATIKQRKTAPKSMAVLSVFWSLRTTPRPEGETLDEHGTIWACTVLDRAFEEEIRQAHAPTIALGSGWAHGWTAIVAEPKRWQPARKAEARRRNLRKRLEKKFPLFADAFEAAEVAKRPHYYDAQAIEQGEDMAPPMQRVQISPRRRLPRLVRNKDQGIQLDLFAATIQQEERCAAPREMTEALDVQRHRRRHPELFSELPSHIIGLEDDLSGLQDTPIWIDSPGLHLSTVNR